MQEMASTKSKNIQDSLSLSLSLNSSLNEVKKLERYVLKKHCKNNAFLSCRPLRNQLQSKDLRTLRCISSEAVARRCSVKKGVLSNFLNVTGKHLCQSLFFNKVAGLRPASLFKKRPWHRCFPVTFTKLLTTSFLQNTSG